MPIKNYFLVVLFFTGLVYVPATAQYSRVPDSIFQQRMTDSVIRNYFNAVGENMHLYNGSEYAGSYNRSSGHPYFESDRLQKGTILYDAVSYQDIPLSYDIARDELIISNYAQNFNIKLVPEKVVYFSMLNHVFVRIDPDSLLVNSIKPGFYEMLYNGKMMVLAKRVKQLQSGAAEDKPKFVEYNRYYIRQSNSFKQLESERDLLDVFGDQKGEVKKYLHKNGFRYKKNPGNTIVKAAEYYVQLKK